MSEETEKPKTDLTPERVKELQTALTGNAEQLFAIMQHPSMEVIAASLKNRNLSGEHLLILLKRGDLHENLLKAVYKQDRIELDNQLRFAIAMNKNTPAQITLAVMKHIFTFDLVKICEIPGTSPDKKVAAERTISQRIPTMPLGHKITLARRASPALLAELIKDKTPQIVEICINSPRMRDGAVMQFINSAYPTPETISVIARSEKWKNRPQVRMALLKNPKTPNVWFTMFLPKISLGELKNLGMSSKLNPGQRRLVQEELKKKKGR